jgi:hypothetical protein
VGRAPQQLLDDDAVAPLAVELAVAPVHADDPESSALVRARFPVFVKIRETSFQNPCRVFAGERVERDVWH